MKFELLISTMHKNTAEVLQMLENSNVKCDTLVVVQGDVEGYEEINRGGQTIRIFFSTERGLSKSRNVATLNTKADYAFIMDDDVIVDNSAFLEITGLAHRDTIDVMTCRFLYENGNSSKPYSDVAFFHNYISSASVSSIEIGFNVQRVRDCQIEFDEKFGLGTELPSGEEYIFITDCLKKGLKVKYHPINIGVHPNETSGMDFYTSSEKILAKREMLKRIFTWKSPLFILAFWLRKLPVVVKAGYGLEFTKTILFGVK